MPFGTEGLEGSRGLALSGGGFRATLFHLGTLWRLNELGLLGSLDRISSVSGGSITSGLLAVKWSALPWGDGGRVPQAQFGAILVDPLRDFCRRSIDLPAIGLGALLPGRDVSGQVEDAYRRHLFGEATLQDLPDAPRFVFNSTNLMTGVDFRFSKPYAGDYRIGLVRNPTWRVALAVTASSAFPPFLSPVERPVDPGLFERVVGADLYDREEYRQRIFLSDGGVYDNLGLETIVKRCRTVLVSDAGAPLRPTPSPASAWHAQALRAMDIAVEQDRALRKLRLMADFESGTRNGAYWGITTKIADYRLPDTLNVTEAATRYLSSIRTRLDPFSEDEQERLINGGYALCDAAVRRAGLAPAAPPPQWPYPARALDRNIPAPEPED